jgi:hypothetical protein
MAKRQTTPLVLEIRPLLRQAKEIMVVPVLAGHHLLEQVVAVAALAGQVLPLVRQVLVEMEAPQTHRLLAALQFITPEAVVAATKCREPPALVAEHQPRLKKAAVVMVAMGQEIRVLPEPLTQVVAVAAEVLLVAQAVPVS